MGVLDQVKEMKEQGLTEQEIIENLQEQGFKPKQIKDALEQARIKEVIEMPTQEEYPEENYEEIPAEEEMPAEGEYTSEEEYPAEETPEQYYPQEEYPAEEGAYVSEINPENTIEIAEQVFEEKMKKTHKQLDELKEFSTLAGAKLSNIDERIRKVETIIDNLQIKILERVGSYGQGLDTIKKEMTMMQDSFSKVVPEIARKQIQKNLKPKIEKAKKQKSKTSSKKR